MMRPTTTEVDLALLISKLDSPTASNASKLLALEVIALRQELQHARELYHMSMRQLEPALEREHLKLVEIQTLTAELSESKRSIGEAAQAAATLQRNVDGLAHKMVLDQRDKIRAQLARVEALCHMQHEDSAVSIGDIRAALRGEP